MRTLFLAWNDTVRRCWYPIGRLTRDRGLYFFSYTRGAKRAFEEAGLEPHLSFPDFEHLYIAEQPFPTFKNRMMSPKRPDYPEFVSYLNLPPGEQDPLVVLARSGGKKATDPMEVFALPEPGANGEYDVQFMAHGIRHLPAGSVTRLLQLEAGEPLLLMSDFQNPADPQALALRTAERTPGDVHLVGYVPRYLRNDIRRLCALTKVELTVAKVNPHPAYAEFRLVCRVRCPWPTGFEPMSDPEFQHLRPDAEEQIAHYVAREAPAA